MKKGSHFVEGVREEISKSLIEHYKTHEHPKGMLGKKHAKKAIEKMRKSKRGKKRKPFSKKHKQKLREASLGEKNHFYGKQHTEETKEMIREKKKGQKHTIKTIRKMRRVQKGRIITNDHARKIGEALKGENNPMKRIEVREKNAITNRKTHKKLWSNPKYAKKMFKAFGKKPNKLEKKLINLIEQHNLPFKYVGDGEFFLGGKCPDFLNCNGKKQLIELYGDYWHRNNNPQDRIDFFKQYGFDTLVLWEHELENEKEVIERIEMFEKR